MIVMVSDLHLDARTAGRPRFKELQSSLQSAKDYAIAHKAELFCFLGDLTDPDSGPCVFRCVEEAIGVAMDLEDHAIPSVWVAGNHDVIEDGNGNTTLSPLRALGGEVHVAERPWTRRIGRLAVSALPFTATSHAYDVTEFVRSTSVGSGTPHHLVLSHLNITGVQPGEETKEMARGREVLLPRGALTERFPLANLFSGHYHRRQLFAPNDGALPVQIVGSLARLTHGEEENDPGFLVVTL